MTGVQTCALPIYVLWSEVAVPADPEKADTDEFDYTFAGWTPALPAAADTVTESLTFKATYTFARRSYTVTWNNFDGSFIVSDTVEYGKTPVYAGAEPQREPLGELVYHFTGWSPAVSAVTGDVVYTAQFSATVDVEGVWAEIGRAHV